MFGLHLCWETPQTLGRLKGDSVITGVEWGSVWHGGRVQTHVFVRRALMLRGSSSSRSRGENKQVNKQNGDCCQRSDSRITQEITFVKGQTSNGKNEKCNHPLSESPETCDFFFLSLNEAAVTSKAVGTTQKPTKIMEKEKPFIHVFGVCNSLPSLLASASLYLPH